jgi:flagellar motor switch protein FliM
MKVKNITLSWVVLKIIVLFVKISIKLIIPALILKKIAEKIYKFMHSHSLSIFIFL